MSKGYSGLFKNTKGSTATGSNQINFYIGPNGKVLEAKYKNWIGVNRHEQLLKKAKNQKLKNAINQLYRPGAFIGDGGTASALKFEYTTGIGLGKNGNFHTQKALDIIKYLNNKVLSDVTLSSGDRKLAKSLKNKLIKALGENINEK